MWVVCHVLYAISYTLEQEGLLDKIETAECPVTMDDYIADQDVDFASLHPCAYSRLQVYLPLRSLDAFTLTLRVCVRVHAAQACTT